MAANWGEIAVVDYVIKLGVSLLFFVPMYGVALNAIIRVMKRREAMAPAVKAASSAASCP